MTPGTSGQPGDDPVFTVPDDARDLDSDRLELLAQWRREARRRRLRRLVLTRRWDRFGLSGPIVVLCLAATACVGALAVVFAPSPRIAPPAATTLADVDRLPVPAVGEVQATAAADVEPASGQVIGHLLPLVPLQTDVSTGATATTDVLRPAVVLLLPPTCTCGRQVTALYNQAREFRLPLWLVASGDPGSSLDVRRYLDAVNTQQAGGGARWAVEADGALARALRQRGLTVVVTGTDGRIADVHRALDSDDVRTPSLELLLAGISAGSTR